MTTQNRQSRSSPVSAICDALDKRHWADAAAQFSRRVLAFGSDETTGYGEIAKESNRIYRVT